MWQVLKITNNPIQASVTLINNDRAACTTTDWRDADKLARATIPVARLNATAIGLTGRAMRSYVSQNY